MLAAVFRAEFALFFLCTASTGFVKVTFFLSLSLFIFIYTFFFVVQVVAQ